ncbi:MAG: polyprenyl diphosphate synthase [Roseiflexaceae bacterium]|jgi:undecaprenyl diphosphate synthase|nr:polyprenyl diphosphate synthase [Chloroflexaceae bacterium]
MSDATTPSQTSGVPRHIAVIMDGNGRWAKQRGLSRHAGHRAGVENIRPIIRAAADIGVQFLTLYAFSTENWRRPSLEVQGLMTILSEFLDREVDNLRNENVRIVHLGSFDGVMPHLAEKIRQAVARTSHCTRITLAVAFNYGGRHDIINAIQTIIASGVPAHAINEALISAHLSTRGIPDPDFIIRTSGEWRLSNFLIWEAAYSEYWTCPVFWPDFTPELLQQAVSDYGKRDRRFGGLTSKT